MRMWRIYRYTDGKTYRLRRAFSRKADAEACAQVLSRKYPCSAFRIERGYVG